MGVGGVVAGSDASVRIALDVLEYLLEGWQIIDSNWRYLYVNQTVALQAQTTKQKLLGRTMMECFPGIEKTPMFLVLQRCMVERKPDRLENRFDFPDGKHAIFELRFVPVAEGVCILSLDITDAKLAAAKLAEMEDQLRLAQKMEAVGRLAGNVAHDFNNLLSIIQTYASLLVAGAPLGNPVPQDLLEIIKACDRASALTKQLLMFSRDQVLEPKILSLNEVVANMQNSLQHVVGPTIHLKVSLPPRIRHIMANPGHLEQVVMNLVVNAKDAMPDGGKLTVETRDIDLDEQYAASHIGVTAGPHVMLAVSDTGMGMDAATVRRIFEPFFTTKEKGKGTGLGLSIVFGIARQSQGNVWVYSEPGVGTTFKVYFPVTEHVDRQSQPHRRRRLSRGSETVLLVEDDQQLRTALHKVLQRSGYHVLEVASGEEAQQMCATGEHCIDVLLTDIVMPEVSGPELAQSLKSSQPDMKVIYTSGYTETSIIHREILAPGFAMLEKPIMPDVLLGKLREVLEET